MLQLSEGLHISFCGSYNVVLGNYSLQNFSWGRGSISSSRPISGTIIQFLPTMSWLRISDAWYIHSKFEHGCDLDFRQITLDLLYSTLSCYGGHKCLVLNFDNWSKALQIILRQQVFNSKIACDLSRYIVLLWWTLFSTDMIIGRWL